MRAAGSDQRRGYEFLERFMGFPKEQEEILVAATDHDSSGAWRAYCTCQRIRDRAVYLHIVLITQRDSEGTRKAEMEPL
jgi:hypothetical protein